MPGRPSLAPRPPSRKTASLWNETSSALIVVDEVGLKSEAWAELHTVRKRQEKAARDLHRHEETDRPAFDAWMRDTFPQQITLLRQLHEEVFAKGQRVQTVEAIAAMTGRSARKIWLEEKERAANPAPDDDDETEKSSGKKRRAEGEADPFGDDDDFFRDDPDGPRGRSRAGWRDTFDVESDSSRGGPRPSEAARDVYRRLVQRIHPDRGGDWTAARQRLWHQVQEAWAAGDADWLTRLEVEWEAAHDVLNPNSPLSRLRSAITEMHAARRDLERKLRGYRDSPQWRFTLSPKKREQLHRRTEQNFQHDITFLQRQLAHLNALIASWEEAPRARRRSRSQDIDVRYFE